MKPLLSWVSIGVALAVAQIPAIAQPVISAKSGVVDYIDGAVFLGSQQLQYSPTHFTDIKENEILSTKDGRAEVLLTPGVILRLGENSSIKMITNRLIDTRLELLTGSASVEADQIAKDNGVTIACKGGQVSLVKAGIYRFDADPGQVRVYKGEAQVASNGNTTVVGGGKMMMLTGTEASVTKFDENETDSLDNWSHRRGEYMAMANASAAKSLTSSGALSSLGWGLGGPCTGAWGFNQWYGMMTYIPCSGMFVSPWGYQFWSPYTVMRAYYPGMYGGWRGGQYGGGGGGYTAGFPYSTAARTSGGYSGVMASAPSMGSMGSMGSRGGGMGSTAMGGSTASAGASAGSAGHGGGGGGGAAAGGGASGGHGR